MSTPTWPEYTCLSHQADDPLANPELRVLRRHSNDHVPSLQAANPWGEHLRENNVAGLIESRYHGRPGALRVRKVKNAVRYQPHEKC